MRWLLLLIIILTLSCSEKNPMNDGSSDGTGTAIIKVTVASDSKAKAVAAQATTRARVFFYVQIGELKMEQELAMSGLTASGTVKIKAGTYLVNVEGYDSSNAMTYFGSTSNVTITAGKKTTVSIQLKPYIPGVPVLRGPSSSVTAGTEYNLSWDAVSRAASYTIEESSNSSFSGSSSATVTGTTNTYTTIKGGTYYYRVKANNTTGSSGWSNTVTVTVKSSSSSGETTTYNNITFVSIPSGTFRMGDVENYGQYSSEKPVHSVTLSLFEMSIYEVTQGQYQAVIGTNPSNSYGVGDNYPGYFVSWYDAVKFCNRLSEQMGYGKCYTESGNWDCDFSRNGFRLPTEAEWEYACRAGTETNFYTGNAISSNGQTSTDMDRAGWYYGNSGRKTHLVGEKEKNAFGLFDMHGNVCEWCNDWYGLYTSDSQTNPTGPTSGSGRVVRGGGWYIDAGYCRSAFRVRLYPSDSGGNVGIGFRVVRRP